MSAIGWALVHFLWQGLLVALLLALGLRLMRNASAQARYASACAALAVMALLVPATALLTGGTDGIATLAADQPMLGLRMTLDAVESAPGVLERLQGWCNVNMSWLLLAWALGASFLLLRAAGGWYVARKQSRDGLPMDYALSRLMDRMAMTGTVEIYRSALAVTPQVFGWLKPVIVVPAALLAQLTPEQLEAVLAHELAHIRRRDYLVNVLQTVVESLLFYHPAVWWVSNRVRVERELCCDDVAVSVCGDRLEYSKALLRLEEVTPAMTMAASGNGLKERIARLLTGERETPWTWSAPMAPVAAAAAAVMMLGGTWWLQAQPPAPPAPPAPPSEIAADAPPAPPPAPPAPPAPPSEIAADAPPAPPATPIAAAAAQARPAPPVPAVPATAPPPPPPPPAGGVSGGVAGGIEGGIDAEEIRRVSESIKVELEKAKETLKIDEVKVRAEIERAMAETKKLRSEMMTGEARRAVEQALLQLDRNKEQLVRKIENARRQVEMSALHASKAQERAGQAKLRAEERQKERERRIAYANERFGRDGVEGVNTDKGRTYLRHGPPDEIESRPAAGDVWKYKNYQGSGGTMVFDFDGQGKLKPAK